MDCVIEETDRRVGAVPDSSVREIQVRLEGRLVAIVRGCCFHWNWMDEAATEVIEREMTQ